MTGFVFLHQRDHAAAQSRADDLAAQHAVGRVQRIAKLIDLLR